MRGSIIARCDCMVGKYNIVLDFDWARELMQSVRSLTGW